MVKLQYIYRDLMYEYWEVGFCPIRLPELYKDVYLAQFKNNVNNAPRCDIVFLPSSWLPSVLHSTENNQGEIDVPVGKLGRKWENHENRRNKDIFR